MALPKGYSATQIALHWVVAGLILFQLVFGEAMSGAWDAFEDGRTPDMTLGVWAHIVAGIAVLIFALWRLKLRASRGAPEAPQASALLMATAKWGHWALYAVLLLTPLSGLAAWYGGLTTAAEVHGWFKPVIIVLVAGHVLATLYHQFIRKDALLMRMRRPLD